MKLIAKIILVVLTIVLFCVVNLSYAFELNLAKSSNQPTIVFIDDDFNPSTPGWGYDHFDNLQNGIDNVTNFGIVNIYPGDYTPFKIQNRSNLNIKSIDINAPFISGNQIVLDELTDPPENIKCVIFVNDSINIELNKLNISGIGLEGRSYAIFYNGSTGKIDNCVVSPNQKGNMDSLGIRAQWNSILSVENSTIQNYGRIGIYCRTGTILNVYKNKIVGQIYIPSDGDFVSYGIEVEDLISASSATIRCNDIYNHDHTGNPTWSSAGIIIDSWRYYKVTPDKCSAIIEYNNIYANMLGVHIVPNENIHVNLNKICNNSDFGAATMPYWDGTKYVYEYLDAINNWWGSDTGPLNNNTNPNGTGNEITDYVTFDPWIDNYLPTIKIISPEPGFLYFNFKDWFEFKFPFVMTLLIGKNNVEVEVTKGLYDIEKVDFVVDDILKYTDYTASYVWIWNELTSFRGFDLKVVVHDINGFQTTDVMKVWKFQFLGTK